MRHLQNSINAECHIILHMSIRVVKKVSTSTTYNGLTVTEQSMREGQNSGKAGAPRLN